MLPISHPTAAVQRQPAFSKKPRACSASRYLLRIRQAEKIDLSGTLRDFDQQSRGNADAPQIGAEFQVAVAQVPSQVVGDIPATVPRALLPWFIQNPILERSPTIDRIRSLRILC
jgi:hypothetical protein